MKSLANQLKTRAVLKGFFKALWGMVCVHMAYGFFPKVLDNKDICALPGCTKKTKGKFVYCCKEHKHLHKAGIR